MKSKTLSRTSSPDTRTREHEMNRNRGSNSGLLGTSSGLRLYSGFGRLLDIGVGLRLEIKIHLYKQGKGPIDIFTSSLGGWDQDQLEVGDILDKYGLKCLYAFNQIQKTRGLPIRFDPKNGRSLLPYKDGSVICVDGEPKDSLIKPITRILVGVAILTVLIVLVMKETPGWAKKLNITGVDFSVPPWVLACVVIVFTRLRKRTRDFFTKTR